MKKYRVKLNVDLLKFKKDQIIVLTENSSGIKLTTYWRNRLRDSKIDNCLEILNETKESKNSHSHSKKSRGNK